MKKPVELPIEDTAEELADFDEGGLEQAREPSQFAKDIRNLKAAVEKSLSTRERLPQPMFWSLFNLRIQELKRQRQLKRSIEELLG